MPKHSVKPSHGQRYLVNSPNETCGGKQNGKF